MIHEIGLELGARLAEQGVPLPVVDGPENPSTMWGRERIVIEHAEGNDAYGGPRSQRIAPKHRYTRSVPYKITIFVKSGRAGAALFEHKRRAELALDKVLCAMDYVAAVRKNHWEPTSGKFITPADLAGSENPGGAVYELSFTFDRAVIDRNWANAEGDTFTITEGNLSTSVFASHARGEDDDDDTQTVPASAEEVTA